MTDYRTAEGVARRRVENELRRRNLLLDAINRVFQEALTCESEADVANACLVVAEQLTDSRFGFLGIINSAGRFDTIALSDPGWQACRMPETQAVVLIRNMEVRGIWSKPISQEKPVIVNEPDSDPDRVGVPEGHPAITCYLGIPLKHGGKTIGLIGLANRESGYEENNQADIEALAVAFVEALYRKRAEVELRKAHDELEMRVQERTSELATANRCRSDGTRPTLPGLLWLSSQIQVRLDRRLVACIIGTCGWLSVDSGFLGWFVATALHLVVKQLNLRRILCFFVPIVSVVTEFDVRPVS